ALPCNAGRCAPCPTGEHPAARTVRCAGRARGASGDRVGRWRLRNDAARPRQRCRGRARGRCRATMDRAPVPLLRPAPTLKSQARRGRTPASRQAAMPGRAAWRARANRAGRSTTWPHSRTRRGGRGVDMAGKARAIRAYVRREASRQCFHIAAWRALALPRGPDDQPTDRRERARLPGPGPCPALGAATPDRQQHRQRRHARLCRPRHGFREDAAGGEGDPVAGANRFDHESRTYRQCQPGLERRPGRKRSALRDAEPDQSRPQHRRHGPRARQLRRQLGEVRSDAALHRRQRQDAALGHQRSIRSASMSMLSIFNVSGSAASAQSQRLNVVASNLANVDTVAGPDGQAYKARQVTFQTQLLGESADDPSAAGVRVSTVTEDQTPGRRVHDPANPSADADGYVTYSNVNAVEEMVNMISASRSYQNNLEVMNTAKTLLLKTIRLGS